VCDRAVELWGRLCVMGEERGELRGRLGATVGSSGGPCMCGRVSAIVTVRSTWRVLWGLGQGELCVREGRAWGKLRGWGQWGDLGVWHGVSALWFVKVRPSLITVP